MSAKRENPDLAPLCAILDVDAAARAGWPILDLAAAYLRGGARYLQLRAKTMPGDALLATASAVVQLAHQHQARVIINDRADIARLAAADGVHIGQDDLPPAAVRDLVGDAAEVGLSTHTVEQIERAVLEPVSYVAVGPVFGTATKATGYAPIGLEIVREAARWLSSATSFPRATPRRGCGRLSNGSRLTNGPAYNRRVFAAGVFRTERVHSGWSIDSNEINRSPHGRGPGDR